MSKRVYTDTDSSGMKWRWEGSRPISELADKIMDELKQENHKKEVITRYLQFTKKIPIEIKNKHRVFWG